MKEAKKTLHFFIYHYYLKTTSGLLQIVFHVKPWRCNVPHRTQCKTFDGSQIYILNRILHCIYPRNSPSAKAIHGTSCSQQHSISRRAF